MANRDFTYSLSKFNLLTTLLRVVNRSAHDDTNATIAKYLLDHYEDLEQVNIYDVASDCFVSRASIQRFSKSIGFDSFTDLKLAHAANRGDLEAIASYLATPGSPQLIMDHIDLMMQDVASTVETEMFREALRLIHDSNVVCLTCAATSHTGSRKLQEDLFVAGRLIRIVEDAANMQDVVDQLGTNDLLITVSGTGIYALAIQDCLTEVQAHKLLVTMNASPEVACGYDRTLLIGKGHLNEPALPGHGGIRDVYLRYGMPFFLDLLAHAYVSSYSSR